MNSKTLALADAIASQLQSGETIQRALVVGCGNGTEATDLATYFGSQTDAIDVDDQFTGHNNLVRFSKMDAQALDFEGETFDLVYSFHALEHIPNPHRAIAEIKRVLRDDGIFCIGTPNKSRLVGYIGGHHIDGRAASLREKIAWNLKDWSDRLAGRFHNELGAHAGFTAGELESLCGSIGRSESVTFSYYRSVYKRHIRKVRLLEWSGLWRWTFPCCYVIGRRTRASDLSPGKISEYENGRNLLGQDSHAQ